MRLPAARAAPPDLTRLAHLDYLSAVRSDPPQPIDRATVISREAAFHDALAEGWDVEAAEPRPPDQLEAAILAATGPINGRHVLDYGCGDGILSIHFADRGAASVTGIDISTRSVQFAGQRARRFRPGAPIEFVATNAETTGLPDAAFDIVAGKLVLHHLDLGAAVDEVYRLLRPGGRGVFIETSGLNPLLMIARKQIVHRGWFGAVRVGTEDEHPLTRSDLRILRSRFRATNVDFPVFWLFRPFAYQVLAPRYPGLGHRVVALDERVEQNLRMLKPLSYYMRIVVTK